MRPLFSSLEKYLLQQAMTFEKEVRNAARESIAPKGKFIRPTLTFAAAAGGAPDKTSLSDPKISKKIANCVRTICEGEIRQTLADRKKNVTRKRYYEIAYGKTAVLFELACALGAMAIRPKNGWIEAAEEVGKQLGIAYQIYDDICDWFMSESDAGKTLGTDLISGKQTYPLIILLEKLPKRESDKLAKNLPNSNPADIALQMRDLDIPSECSKEFARRISTAEKILQKYQVEGRKLNEFCAAMRKLRLG